MRKTALERFNDSYIVDQKTGCWIWQKTKDAPGYGIFYFENHFIHAHRWIYQHLNGEMPKNIFACHKCDNPPCVNPEHIFAGTHADNMRDMKKKGRECSPERKSAIMKEKAARGDKNGSRTHIEKIKRGPDHHSHLRPELVQKGEEASGAKLTEEKAIQIILLYKTGIFLQRELAERFGLKDRSISDITTGKTWRHLNEFRK